MKPSPSSPRVGRIRRFLRPAPYVATAAAAGMLALLWYSPEGQEGGGGIDVLNGASIANPDGSSAGASPPVTSNAQLRKEEAEARRYAIPILDGPPRTVVGDTEKIWRKHPFGELRVQVTVGGGRITDVNMQHLDTYDGRSEEIANFSLPALMLQSVTTGNAKVDGISSATYTSQAYERSLQSAIDQLRG